MQKEIAKSFESGRVLVFPTEVSARTNLDEYVRQNGGVCFADRAVSWDTFLAQSRNTPEGRRKASFQHRLLFAQRFAGKGELAGTLRYFVPTGVGDTEAFVKPLAVALPHFFRLEEEDVKAMLPAACSHDIGIILPLYREFLERNGLYEEDACEPDFAWARETHVLVYPQTYADCNVEKALEAGLEKVDAPQECAVGIHSYANSVCEVRDVMRRIRRLLQEGTASCDIALTCAADEYRPYLEDEAARRGIRIEFASGRRLSDYAVAGVFSELAGFFSGGMEFGAFRKLVTDPVIPFRNRWELLDILRCAIDNKIAFGRDRWDGKLDFKYRATLFKLESYARGVATATSFAKLAAAFRGFQDDFLADGGFGVLSDRIQVDAFQRCMEVLEDLGDMQTAMGPERIDAFQFFTDVLSATIYAPKADRSAIQVYSYPITCPPAARHSFVVGLSDEASQKRRSPVPFYTSLDDSFESRTGSRDISSEIVRAYASDGVFMSYSEATFSGAASVPAAFLMDGGEVKECAKPHDELTVEEEAWRTGLPPAAGKPTTLQGEWNARGVSTFVDGKKEFPKAEEPVRLSATSVAEYEKCPYRWLCKYAFKASEEDLDCVQTKANEIGEVLHETYERFMVKWKTTDSMGSKAALDDLQAIFEEELERYASDRKGPDALHIMRIRNEQKPLVGKIAEAGGFELLSGGEHVMSEGRMEWTDPEKGVCMQGFPDCVIRTPGGSFAVVDFKKKIVDKDSIQLAMYSSLMEHDDRFNAVPSTAMFYSIAEGRFVIQWKSVEEFKLLEEGFSKRMDDFVDSLRNGEFDPKPSEKACTGCPYRQICRRRYVVK